MRGARRAALLIPLLSLLSCGQPEAPRWNVLLVTFDTTRADHLQPYGHPRTATPTLQWLADEGALFEQAFTAAPITAPSHASILTGRYPMAHGVRDNGLFTLAAEETTLAEILRAQGYATAAAVGAFPVIGRFGFNQGFDLFDDALTGHLEDHLGERIVPKARLFFDERRAAQVNEAVLPWLDEQSQTGRPFFVWLHYFDAHQPFEPPPPFDQQYADDLYAGEIAYADQSLGRLLEHLRGLGQLERTLVVMTADHGEGLGEHGELTHAVLAYNSTLHVPLLIRSPDGAGRGKRIEERVGTVDIVPTILQLLQIEVPTPVQGRSLLPLLHGEAGEWRQYYAENLSPHLSHGWGKLRVLFDGEHKYIHGPRPELYDLSADPGELHNLLETAPDTEARIHEELQLFLTDHASGQSISTPVDEETLRRLQSLGYLQGGAGGNTTVSEQLEEGGIAPHLHVSLLNDMSAAKHLLFSGRYVDALTYTRKLVEATPNSPNHVEMHLAALLGAGQTDAAWDFLQQPREIDYQPAEQIITVLALARFRSGQVDEAVALLRQHLDSHCSAQSWWTLASLEEVQGQTEAAATALEQALDCDPTHWRARIDRAVGLDRRGQPEAAEADFLQAMRDAPFEARVTYNYATFLSTHGRPEEARQWFERSVALSPGYLRAQLARVSLAVDSHDRETAERWLARLQQTAPGSPEATAARAALAAQSDTGAP
ncbi:MAG: sulfatase-like hydrolase/transferase [Xanthomonadales bacterium]|nr:sulfatase-like hydrolase/transferase [Xanthomonadales bacterium]